MLHDTVAPNPTVLMENFEEIINGKLWYIELPVNEGQRELLRIDAGATIAPHIHHRTYVEVIVLEGEGWIRIGNVVKKYKKGDFLRIPMKSIHSFTAKSETCLYSSSLGYSEEDTEYIHEEYPLYEMLCESGEYEFLPLYHASSIIYYRPNVNVIGGRVLDHLGAFPRKMIKEDRKLIESFPIIK